MRIIIPGFLSLFLLTSSAATAQSFVIEGSAGRTVNDAGYTFAAGGGFTPQSHLTLLVEVERTHIFSRVRSDGRGGGSAFRGGTLTLGSAQLQASLFRRDRIGPYGLVGLAAGISRPNVTDLFPNRLRNEVGAMFFGGGIQVPLRNRLGIFADVRVLFGAENGETLAVLPIRGGLSWQF